MAYRAYVRVLVDVDEAGRNRPVKFYWENGQGYEVDRVLDVRRAACVGTGGQGMRYTCRVRGRSVCLYEDGGRWFVETKDVPLRYYQA